MWVTLFYFFAGSPINHISSHTTGSEWHCFISALGSLITIMSHTTTNSMWVALLYPLSYQSCLIPQLTGSEWHCFISVSGSLITISSHITTNSLWVTLLYSVISSIITHAMTNREWATLFYSAVLVCKAISSWSYDQQWVSDSTLPLQESHHVMTNREWVMLQIFVSSIMTCPTTNRKWVALLYCCARQSHQSWPIPWPTGSEWHCFKSLSHQSCHIPQPTGSEWHCLFLCQAVSSQSCLISQPTVCMWHCFISLSYQSHLIPWPTGSEWYYLLSFPGGFVNYVSLPTACEWHCSIALPSSLINHDSSHDQQYVSGIPLFLCLPPDHPRLYVLWSFLWNSFIASHPVTNS